MGQENPLEKGKGTYSSILAWRISQKEKPGRLYTMGYYQAIKKSEFVSILVGWMNLEAVIQNEISQKGEKKRHSKLMCVYIYVYIHTHTHTYGDTRGR